MLITIFDVPQELRTEELQTLIRRATVEKFKVDTGCVAVSLSPIQTASRGPHGVLVMGLDMSQTHEYRTMIEVVSGACAAYFTTHGYLWYGASNPYIARPKE